MAYDGWDAGSGGGTGRRAPGSGFQDFDAASRRRYMESLRAPKPTWDAPDGWGGGADAAGGPDWGAPQAAARSSNPATQQMADPTLLAYRDLAMSDAAARGAGARLTAQNASGDPSLAAYGALEGELRGQSDAARQFGGYEAQHLSSLDERANAEYMLRLRQQLEEEQLRRMNQGSWLGELGDIGGRIASAYFTGGYAG